MPHGYTISQCLMPHGYTISQCQMPHGYTIHSFIHSFIHSGHFYSAPSSPLPLRGAPDYSTDTVSEFHAEAHRQLQVKDLLAQGPYMTARTGVEPMTLRLKVVDSTKAPSRPTH